MMSLRNLFTKLTIDQIFHSFSYPRPQSSWALAVFASQSPELLYEARKHHELHSKVAHLESSSCPAAGKHIQEKKHDGCKTAFQKNILENETKKEPLTQFSNKFLGTWSIWHVFSSDHKLHLICNHSHAKGSKVDGWSNNFNLPR